MKMHKFALVALSVLTAVTAVADPVAQTCTRDVVQTLSSDISCSPMRFNKTPCTGICYKPLSTIYANYCTSTWMFWSTCSYKSAQVITAVFKSTDCVDGTDQTFCQCDAEHWSQYSDVTVIAPDC